MQMRKFVSCLFVLVLAAACSEPKKAEPSTPEKYNIVFIMADDLGWNQVGFNGSTFYETPNIDRIAAEGTVFTNAYASASICSPSRAAFMTGKNPARLHITDYVPGSPYPYARLTTPAMVTALPLQEITVAEMLKGQGYATGHFGKWHLNSDKNYAPNRPGDPASQGFDDVLTTEKPVEGQDPGKDAHNSKLISGRAIAFIEQNKDKPFFAYVSYNAVHRPIMESPELIAKYAAKPGSKDSVNNPVMGAMLETMDKGIGEILSKLTALGLTEKTIVVFYSDNGGLKLLQDQKPFRGGKAMVFEGGNRVPLAFKWPGVTKPGTRISEKVITTDFFPTFAAIAGAQSLPKNIDGQNLVPLLKQQGSLNRDALYWHYPHYHHLGYKPGAAIIKGEYKLIEWFEPFLTNQGNAYSLFKISNDIGETTDLSQRMPDKVTELKNDLHAWQKRMNAQMMTVNAGYNPARANWQFKDKKTD